jgi:hypothetical protein
MTFHTKEWALGQIKDGDSWLDYARGSYWESRRWAERDENNRRVVTYIGKDVVYPLIVKEVDNSDWADFELPNHPYTVGGSVNGESFEHFYASMDDALEAADWFNRSWLGTTYNTSWGEDMNLSPARITHYSHVMGTATGI